MMDSTTSSLRSAGTTTFTSTLWTKAACTAAPR